MYVLLQNFLFKHVHLLPDIAWHAVKKTLKNKENFTEFSEKEETYLDMLTCNCIAVYEPPDLILKPCSDTPKKSSSVIFSRNRDNSS